MNDSYQGLRFHLHMGRTALQRVWRKKSLTIGLSSLRMEELIPPLVANRAEWVAIKPILSGICGSDISVIRGTGSPYLAPLVSFPAVLGHEVVATIESPQGPWPPGTRVVINPTLACAARDLPLCPACRRNEPDECANRGDTGLGPGLILGYHRSLPGGWSSRMWVPRHQVIPIPDSLPDTRAVLTEPASIVFQALARIRWQSVESILIIGAGPIGLLATWAAHTKYAVLNLAVRARYQYQAEMAEALGASQVYVGRDDRSFVEDPGLNPRAGNTLPRFLNGWPYRTAGFDVVIDSVGSPDSLYQSLCLTRPGGQIVLLGGASIMTLDLTPLWTRRLTLLGTFGYGNHTVTPQAETFRDVIQRLTTTPAPIEQLVTHAFPLSHYRDALQTLHNRNSKALKVVFENQV